jgi:nucleotide-binding universal stress UspA family protein
MAIYQRILLAVDLAPDSLLIGQRAQALSVALGAELRMIHVVEPIPPVAPIPPDPIVGLADQPNQDLS